ncbi:MAG: ATP-binding protein [Paludibacteraceae bacterium]|nr:ATP-binding protein [Paludibacteraceae bacterium]
MKTQRLGKLPVGEQDFEKIRTLGRLYVDKTEFIYKLLDSGTYFFLSRPRRFGKSLFLSTLKAFYEGKRELFEGLAIARHEDVTWEKHPVLYIDLNVNNYDSEEVLKVKLDDSLNEWEGIYGCEDKGLTLGMRFEKVIRRACEQTGKKAVILVDEYEKPLLEAIGKPKLQEAFRDTLRGFYGVLKSMDAYIEFAMLTGVTKFGKLSVFSGLNNLKDISMVERFSDICGITEEELLSNLRQEIQQMADKNDMSYEECVGELRKMYDGYLFHPKGVKVYNPYSLLNALGDYEFGKYWFESGTPTFLVKLLMNREYNLEQLSRENVLADEISSIDTESSNPVPVIYQSGYLTIKGYDPELEQYILGFPNREVEEGFVKRLMRSFIDFKATNTPFNVSAFVKDVRAGDTDQFIDRLRSLFADTPYELIRNLENHYQNILWLLFKLMGFYTHAEYHTNRGRIDLLVKTPLYIYVMEFKLDGTAEEAMAQINSKDYSLPFTTEGQTVVKIGMNFDSQTRNIGRWIVE